MPILKFKHFYNKKRSTQSSIRQTTVEEKKLFNYFYKEQENLNNTIKKVTDTLEKELTNLSEKYPEIKTVQGVLEKYLCILKSIELTNEGSQSISPDNVALNYTAQSFLDIQKEKYPHLFQAELKN